MSGRLVLTLKQGSKIKIGEDVYVEISDNCNVQQVRLAFSGPRTVKINRMDRYPHEKEEEEKDGRS